MSSRELLASAADDLARAGCPSPQVDAEWLLAHALGVTRTELYANGAPAAEDEKSQLQNKTKALRVLRARLFELQRERQQAELSAQRNSQIGSGERAEKIRTYNFPENRLTDHRIKLTVHQLDRILQGDLDEFTDALQAEDRRQALETATA